MTKYQGFEYFNHSNVLSNQRLLFEIEATNMKYWLHYSLP
jgi:hypothetical protein